MQNAFVTVSLTWPDRFFLARRLSIISVVLRKSGLAMQGSNNLYIIIV